MRVLSIEIQDILSIQNATLSFEDNGLVLVEGWNYDTQRANGAGKTAVFNGLAFALYDKLPRKITASEILRRGCKSGFARASVSVGEDVWSVQRSRPKGVKFFKNDVEQDITQNEFESFIRLTYQQFLLTIYTPQANSGWLVRFLSSPDTSKKEFLLQLLNLDQFSGAKKAADEIIKQRQAAVDVETNKITTARARIETYEESLVDVAALTKSIQELQDSLAPVNQEIIELSSVAKPDLSKYLSVEENVRTKTSEIAQAKAKRSIFADQFRTVEFSMNQPIKDTSVCGECGTVLKKGEDQAAHAMKHTKLKDQRADLLAKMEETDVVIAKEQSIADLSRKLREKKQQESADYQAAQLRISELNSFARTKQLQIENANLKLKNSAELSSKIETLQASVDTSLLIIANNKRELELYKTLSAVYSPTGAQAYVLDSVVDSFNEVIQKYIDIMSPNMSYVLNSFKENAKGDVVAKFSETLTKGGTEVSVGSLSGGEEKGLSLCVDFALLEVLETQFGMTLNPIILDEPFDGLDAAGREIVVDLLENLARNRQIFVVDHASESKAMFTKSMRIELRNEISTISLEA